jgi:hypothetical protein
MKKLLFLFSIIILLAAGCNSNQASIQSKPQPNPSQLVAQANLNIIYPAGGETLSLNSVIGIKYAVSANFAKQLMAQDTTELYLLDATGTIVGFIGTINPTEQIYNWQPSNLGHWAGLDIVPQIPTVGNYKILLVSRRKAKPNTSGGDYAADIFIDGVTKFDGTKLVVTNASQPVYPDILAYAVSDVFSLEDTAADNTSEWKTYTNSDLGFAIQYPNNWYYGFGSDMDGNYQEFDFLPNGKTMESGFPITIVVAKNITEQAFIDQNMKINAPNTLTSSTTMLSGQSATYYKITASSYGYTDNYIITNKDGSLYGLQCHDIQSEPCDFTIFDKMVQSFQFTK